MESHKEIAQRFDEVFERGEEGEGLVPVKATTKQNADVVLSIRFTKEEADKIRRTAKDKGIRLSTLIRDAALATATPANEPDRVGEMLIGLRKNLTESIEMMDEVTGKARRRSSPKGAPRTTKRSA